jgi:hypothetical protein
MSAASLFFNATSEKITDPAREDATPRWLNCLNSAAQAKRNRDTMPPSPAIATDNTNEVMTRLTPVWRNTYWINIPIRLAQVGPFSRPRNSARDSGRRVFWSEQVSHNIGLGFLVVLHAHQTQYAWGLTPENRGNWRVWRRAIP